MNKLPRFDAENKGVMASLFDAVRESLKQQGITLHESQMREYVHLHGAVFKEYGFCRSVDQTTLVPDAEELASAIYTRFMKKRAAICFWEYCRSDPTTGLSVTRVCFAYPESEGFTEIQSTADSPFDRLLRRHSA